MGVQVGYFSKRTAVTAKSRNMTVNSISVAGRMGVSQEPTAVPDSKIA